MQNFGVYPFSSNLTVTNENVLIQLWLWYVQCLVCLEECALHNLRRQSNSPVVEDHGVILGLHAIVRPLLLNQLLLEVVCCHPELHQVSRPLLLHELQHHHPSPPSAASTPSCDHHHQQQQQLQHFISYCFHTILQFHCQRMRTQRMYHDAKFTHPHIHANHNNQETAKTQEHTAGGRERESHRDGTDILHTVMLICKP